MKIISKKYWRIELLENQYYLGRSVLILKRKCRFLSGLKDNEIKELFWIINKMEKGLKKEFNATMFNWTCLMNDSYKTNKSLPQVHLHLWPRYKDKVYFEGEEFIDEVFAHHYNKTKTKKVPKKVLIKIRDKMRNFLK